MSTTTDARPTLEEVARQEEQDEGLPFRWRVNWGLAGHVTYCMSGLFVKWEEAIAAYEALPGRMKSIQHIGSNDDSDGNYDEHLEKQDG